MHRILEPELELEQTNNDVQCSNEIIKIGEELRPFWGGELGPHLTQSLGARPTSIPSGIVILPAIWPQEIWAENCGGGKLGPRLTQCGQGRGLPACQVSS